MNVEVIFTQLWTSAIPPHHMLLCCKHCLFRSDIQWRDWYKKMKILPTHTIYSLKHGKHCFVIIVVEKPNARVLVIFFKRHCWLDNQLVRDIQLTYSISKSHIEDRILWTKFIFEVIISDNQLDIQLSKQISGETSVTRNLIIPYNFTDLYYITNMSN